MSPEDLTILLRRKPFYPFRVHMTDGRSFDICHPEVAVPTHRVLFLGMDNGSGAGIAGIFEHTQELAIAHILRIEPLEESAIEPDVVRTA